MSAIVRELIAAGVTGDALVTAIERIEGASASVETRSAGALRQARYREKQNEKKRNENVTSDACDVTGDAKKEIPHTPLEKNTPFVTTNVVTLSPRKSAKRTRCKIPDGWWPSERAVQAFLDLGFDADDLQWHVSEFTDYWSGSGKVMADWDRTFLSRAKQQARYHAKRSKPARNSRADNFAILDAIVAEAERRENEASGGSG